MRWQLHHILKIPFDNFTVYARCWYSGQCSTVNVGLDIVDSNVERVYQTQQGYSYLKFMAREIQHLKINE